MGLRPCSGNCLARVIWGVVGTKGSPDGLNDNAAEWAAGTCWNRGVTTESSCYRDKMDQGRLREPKRHGRQCRVTFIR